MFNYRYNIFSFFLFLFFTINVYAVDEFDINLLVTPGVIHEYHSQVTNHAITKMEDRADAFYVMDGSRWGRSITNAVSDVKGLDTNYAGTYYPWVKIRNNDYVYILPN